MNGGALNIVNSQQSVKPQTIKQQSVKPQTIKKQAIVKPQTIKKQAVKQKVHSPSQPPYPYPPYPYPPYPPPYPYPQPPVQKISVLEKFHRAAGWIKICIILFVIIIVLTIIIIPIVLIVKAVKAFTTCPNGGKHTQNVPRPANILCTSTYGGQAADGVAGVVESAGSCWGLC